MAITQRGSPWWLAPRMALLWMGQTKCRQKHNAGNHDVGEHNAANHNVGEHNTGKQGSNATHRPLDATRYAMRFRAAKSIPSRLMCPTSTTMCVTLYLTRIWRPVGAPCSNCMMSVLRWCHCMPWLSIQPG